MDDLATSYHLCRLIHRRHGRSYYLATRLLPGWKRRHVHALYGFTRYADEIVDGTKALPVAERTRRLESWSASFLAGLAGERPSSEGWSRPGETSRPDGRARRCLPGDRLLPAVLHTIRVFDLDIADFRVFLDSMAMDLTVTEYQTYDDLLRYMAGSAAAIGTMMVPILQAPMRGPAVDPEPAREPARQLGLAFQLTNFIRDVAEDLDLGRVYLPKEDLDAFGVSRADLASARAAGRSTPALRELIRFEIARAREHYAAAEPGIAMLQPSSQPCIRAASRLYGGILDEVERQGYDVFAGRATVSNRRRLRVVAGALFDPPPVVGRVVGVLSGPSQAAV